MEYIIVWRSLLRLGGGKEALLLVDALPRIAARYSVLCTPSIKTAANLDDSLPVSRLGINIDCYSPLARGCLATDPQRHFPIFAGAITKPLSHFAYTNTEYSA